MNMVANKIIQKTMTLIPKIEGPIPVNEWSHPFCAMAHSRKPLKLEDYGYVEEEYFLSGKANIYDSDENDQPVVIKEGICYKNRILLRKPADSKKFSGRVYIDILNATQNYDIEDLWHRMYLWCMEHGHGYIGITSKPVNVMSLKYFDYERYKSLDWSNGDLVPQPAILRYASIPGTEEGLIWDMLGQLCSLVRYGGRNNSFDGAKVDYIYLTGQSQSGAYLNTFIHYFDQYAKDEKERSLFDGYFNIVGALVQRRIRQEDEIGPLRLVGRHIRPTSVPFISISSEGDLSLFNLFFEGDLLKLKIENKNEPHDKCRYYEIAGAPHTDIVCPVLSDIEEIRKTRQPLPNLDEKLLNTLNDFPTEYYICGLLEKLHIWASKKIAPPEVEPLLRGENGLVRDEHGNACGGLRSPFLDVPIASYIASNPDDPEGISGKMIYFSKEKFYHLYHTKENYIDKFAAYVDRQVLEGWISPTDGKKMKLWSCQAVAKVLL